MLTNDERQVKLGNKVLEYKKSLIKNQMVFTDIHIEQIFGVFMNI